jgi:hypothetical protein
MPDTKRSWATWMFLSAALLVPALLPGGAPAGPPADEAALRSTLEVEAGDAGDAAIDESAATPGVCPVFCSTDAFCNTGCSVDSLCRNHRCVQF